MRDNVGGGALTETTFLVLLSLFSPNHGYGIIQFIERETDRRVLLGAGTLYGAINSLLKKKWIEPIGDGEVGSNKKEYIVTELGRQITLDEGTHTFIVDITTNSGDLSFSIKGKDGTVYYDGEALQTSSFTVDVLVRSNAEVVLKADARSHFGSFKVNWDSIAPQA